MIVIFIAVCVKASQYDILLYIYLEKNMHNDTTLFEKYDCRLQFNEKWKFTPWQNKFFTRYTHNLTTSFIVPDKSIG